MPIDCGIAKYGKTPCHHLIILRLEIGDGVVRLLFIREPDDGYFGVIGKTWISPLIDAHRDIGRINRIYIQFTIEILDLVGHIHPAVRVRQRCHKLKAFRQVLSWHRKISV